MSDVRRKRKQRSETNPKYGVIKCSFKTQLDLRVHQATLKRLINSAQLAGASEGTEVATAPGSEVDQSEDLRVRYRLVREFSEKLRTSPGYVMGSTSIRHSARRCRAPWWP